MVKGAVKPGRLLLIHYILPSVHTLAPHPHWRLPSPMPMGRRTPSPVRHATHHTDTAEQEQEQAETTTELLAGQ